MKWNHLPEQGGLYQQNPGILDRFHYIFAEQGKHEAAQQAQRDRESGKLRSAGKRSGRRR